MTARIQLCKDQTKISSIVIDRGDPVLGVVRLSMTYPREAFNLHIHTAVFELYYLYRYLIYVEIGA